MTQSTLRRAGARSLMALTVALAPLTLAASAQDNPVPAASQPGPDQVNYCVAIRNSRTETRTFFLSNTTTANDSNEILVSIRNMLCPSTKVFLDVSRNAVVLQATPDQLTLAEKIIRDLDHPRKTYRLLFTITDVDGDKTISTQHVSMVVVAGERTTLKEGDKIPLATGSYSGASAGTQTQFTYIDVGMNIDATIEEQADGVSLKSKIEQSSAAASNTIAGVQEPVIRQTVLDGTSLLSVGKPIMLGSIDVPNTTHHFDIAVVLQPIK